MGGKFPARAVRDNVDNMLQKLVGRVVAAGSQQQMLYSPAGGKPCVYFHIKVEEEIRVKEVDAEDGAVTYRTEWQEIAEAEQCRDFYIQDGVVKIFVNGANRDKCKISSEEEGGDSEASWFTSKNDPPPGIRALVGLINPHFTWHTDADHDGDIEYRTRTGDLRWSEKSFDLGETLACLGVPVLSNDPYTGQPCKVLQQIDEACLTDEYFEQNGWSGHEQKAWHALTEEPAVLLTDKEEFRDGVDCLAVVNLPVYMTQPLTPQVIAAQPNMYAQQQPMVIPIIQVQYVPPGVVVPLGVVAPPCVVAPPGVVANPNPGVVAAPIAVIGSNVVVPA